jgi:hypothetical protein
MTRQPPVVESGIGALAAFRAETRPKLRQAPLEQLWRDHLLVDSLALDDDSGFDQGTFAVIYRSGNAAAADAVEGYRACLVSPMSISTWTLEEVVEAIVPAGAGSWVSELRGRYLGGG